MRGGLTHLARGCAVALLMLVLGGCGSDGAPVATEAAPSAPVLTPAQQARANARQQRRDRIALEHTFTPNPWREPGTTIPHRTPLGRLIVHDVERGRGPPVTGDERVYADFVKTFWRSGEKFLVAWGPMRAAYLDLSAEAPGMRRGMIGMRPGGRRTISMPKEISDVHPPNGAASTVAAQVDIVLRKILTE